MCIGFKNSSECEIFFITGDRVHGQFVDIADRLNNDPGWRNIKVSTLHLNVSFNSNVLFSSGDFQ